MTRPRRVPRPAAVLATLVATAVLVGCSESPSTGDKGFVSGDGAVTLLDPSARTRPGEVAGTTLEGEEVSLADYAGQVVVLNVWGSWCGPCRKEAPVLARAAAELQGEDVVFLGINTRDSSPEQGLAFQRRYDVPYPSLYDPAGRTLLGFQGTLPPNAIPSTVVVDAEGDVAASIIGEVSSARTLVGLVEDVRDGSATVAEG